MQLGAQLVPGSPYSCWSRRKLTQAGPLPTTLSHSLLVARACFGSEQCYIKSRQGPTQGQGSALCLVTHVWDTEPLTVSSGSAEAVSVIRGPRTSADGPASPPAKRMSGVTWPRPAAAVGKRVRKGQQSRPAGGPCGRWSLWCLVHTPHSPVGGRPQGLEGWEVLAPAGAQGGCLLM